jgi:hypothetical protein
VIKLKKQEKRGENGMNRMLFIFQYVLAFMLLAFSTFASWYEGSELRDIPWEWKYSAFFSKMFNGEVTESSDISQLDHFIYAAKFKPIFPMLMMFSLIYIFILSGYLLLKYNTKKLMVFHFCLGIMFLLLETMVSNSPTVGDKYFTSLFIISCVLNFIISLILFLKLRKRNGEFQNNVFKLPWKNI